MFLARKRLRLARAEGFAEGLARSLAEAGPEQLAAGLASARQKAISKGDFDLDDALRDLQRRFGLPIDVGSQSATIAELEARVRQLEEENRQSRNQAS